jgi:hypothetical protein
VAEPAAGRGVAGDLHRRAEREDPRRHRGQPAGLCGHRRRPRGRQARAGVMGRQGRRGVGEVLAVGVGRAAQPRRRGCVHPVLRRAEGTAGRGHRHLAGHHRPNVCGAPDPGQPAVCVEEALAGDQRGAPTGLHRGRRGRSRGRVSRLRRPVRCPLSRDRAAVADPLGRVHPVPGVPARGTQGHLHHG